MTKNTEDPDSTGQPPDTNRQEQFSSGAQTHLIEHVSSARHTTALFEVIS